MGSGAGGARARLLVVDDDPSIRELLSTLLGEDHDVRTAESGEEALAAVAGGARFDAAILDVMMAGMDGFELAERLRADDRTADLPIIMLTALGDPEHRDRARRAGADAYVSKPFDPELLEATLDVQLAVRLMEA